MPSERFPTSTPPDTSPTEVVIDTHESREHVTDQSDTSGSFLHDGGALLAESLGKLVSENDPAAIRDYLKDILADTEGNVPAAERAATFTLLAERQKQTMRQEVIHVGDQMDAKLDASSKNFDATVTGNTRVLRNALGEFDRNATLMARGKIDRYTQEASLNAAMAMQRKLSEITDAKTAWGNTQRAALDDYRGTLTSTMANEARLRTAGESLTEDYDGDPIDASAVIRGDILEQFATELHNEFTSENAHPAEIIAQLLDTPEDQIALETIHQYKNYVDEYGASLDKMLGNRQTDLTEPTEMLRKYMRNQATVRLGGSAGREQDTIATLQNAPRQIAKNADTLNGKRVELRKRVQSARGNQTPVQKTQKSPHNSAPTPPERTQQPNLGEVNDQTQDVTLETVESIGTTEQVEQRADTEPIATTSVESPVTEPEITTANEEITDELPQVTEVAPEEPAVVEQPPLTYEQPDYSSAKGMKEYIGQEPIEAAAPKISRSAAAETSAKNGIYSLKNLPPEPVGKTKPKVEPKVAESPYGAGYTQFAPHQQSPAERQFSAPGAEAAQTEYVKIKRPAHIRREAAQNQGQPEPRIYRPDDNHSEQKSEPLYNVTHHDVNEMRNIIARQAAEAAKRHPNQTPTWIQMINNPVSSPRKSREERFYESRTGRFLINVGSLAVRAGKFLRRK